MTDITSRPAGEAAELPGQVDDYLAAARRFKLRRLWGLLALCVMLLAPLLTIYAEGWWRHTGGQPGRSRHTRAAGAPPAQGQDLGHRLFCCSRSSSRLSSPRTCLPSSAPPTTSADRTARSEVEDE
jgi:hypothetical protein